MSSGGVNGAPELMSQAEPLDLGARLRELSGFDEDWLLTYGRRVVSVPAACHQLLARCLSGPDATPAEMLGRVRALDLAQRDWLLLELRRLSLGARIKGEVQCSGCGGAEEVEFAAGDLPLPPPARRQPFDVQLPSGNVARLRPLVAGDHEQFAAIAGLNDDAQMALALNWALVSREREVEDLPGADRQALEQALAASVPEELRIDLECHGCGQPLVARFGACEFFLAELRQHSQTLIDDVHALARFYHWSEQDVLRLSLRRRLDYLLRIEAGQDAVRIRIGG